MLFKNTACGFDEVGKGAIAGPVVVASVSFYDYTKIPNDIKDSKKIGPNKRLILHDKIKKLADVGIGIVMPEEIDKLGITEATNLAAQKSLSKNLYFKKNLLDGYIKIKSKNAVKNIIKGDENYVSIAAASIIAKVTRDNIMINKSIQNKQYMWDKNKGYGTKEHLLAIKNYGITNYHRKTFKLRNI